MNDERKTLTDGRQIYPDHRTIVQEGSRKGQQQDYVVRSYKHMKCGGVTTIGQTLA